MILDDENRDGITITGDQDTLPDYIQGTPPSIDTLRRRFEEARDGAQENDAKCQRDRDYYDGPKQLNSEVRATLKARSQPAIYTNRVRPAVNGVLGVLEAGRRDPRAQPRNPDDQDSADVCTKALRYANDASKFDDTQIDCAEDFLIEGTCAAIVEMVDDVPTPVQIRWQEFYYDPYSRRADFKDARYMGVAKWKDADEIMQKWSVRIADIGNPMTPTGGGIFGDKFEDTGNGRGWVDTRRRRVLLVEEYAIVEGEWKRLVYIAAGLLEYGPSPYLDEKQRPMNPIEAASCYVDRDNNRYGFVRDMVPIQDEVNASRSRSLHLMNSRQVQNTDVNAPPVDDMTVRAEAAKADGVIPMGWSIVPTAEQTQANLLRMQEAKSEIERMGPTPAVLGRSDAGSQSGRARLVSQQAGLTELARPMGRLHAWVLRCYEQMWARCQQFWTDPMWIRVTDDTKAPEFLQLNEPVVDEDGRPVMDVDPQTGAPRLQPLMQPDGQPVIDPYTGQPAYGPVQKIINRPAELMMDLILDQDDDTATLAQEVWAELVQLITQAGGMAAVFDPAFEILVEASPLSDKRRILELVRGAREERDQNQMAQMQQQMAQMQAALQEKQQTSQAQEAAKIENTQADTALKVANANKVAAEGAGKELEVAVTAANPALAFGAMD